MNYFFVQSFGFLKVEASNKTNKLKKNPLELIIHYSS